MDDRPSTSTAPQILKLQLKASCGMIINVNEDVASKIKYIRNRIKKEKKKDPSYSWLNTPIPVCQVEGTILKKLLEWCEEHRNETYRPNEGQRTNLTDSDKRYMNVPNDELVSLLKAADTLELPGIVDIICQKIANMLEGKTPEEIRRIFGILDDSDQPKKLSKKARRRARQKKN